MTSPSSGAATMPVPPGHGPSGSSLGVSLGPYRLVQKLGEGGMGVVHLGLDAHGRAVAIKVLRAHIAHDPDARARLSREVLTLSRVRHRLVAEVLDADVDGDQPYVVTRYVPGPTLDGVVRERGPMGADALVQLGRGLLSALEAIHAAGVVHRDLKPGNVLVLDGDPVVIDFGIAHVADDVRLTMTGLVMGTPGYLSPEVVDSSEVTAATDWWGWAATLAFAATGQAPFGRGPTEVVIDRVRRGAADLSGVDERLRPLLAAALSPDASLRPDAAEVMAALERYAGGGQATVAVRAGAAAATKALVEPTRAVLTPPTRPYDARPAAVAAPPMPVWPPPAVAPAPMPAPVDDDPLAVFRPPESGPGAVAAPPPRPRRTGTLLAILAALVGAAAAWPTVTAVAAAALVVLARTADRSVAALELRRRERGPRGSDPVVAVVAAPWHLLRAVLASVPALVLPALLGVSAAFIAGYAQGQAAPVSGSDQITPASSIAVAVGLLVAMLTAWWGPGGGSVRRGSRGLVRGVVVGSSVTSVIVILLLAAAIGAGYLAYSRGQPEFWPVHQLPFGMHVR